MSRFLAAVLALVLFPMSALACGGRDSPCTLPSGNYHMAVPEVDAPRGIVMHLHGGGGRRARDC